MSLGVPITATGVRYGHHLCGRRRGFCTAERASARRVVSTFACARFGVFSSDAFSRGTTTYRGTLRETFGGVFNGAFGRKESARTR